MSPWVVQLILESSGFRRGTSSAAADVRQLSGASREGHREVGVLNSALSTLKRVAATVTFAAATTGLFAFSAAATEARQDAIAYYRVLEVAHDSVRRGAEAYDFAREHAFRLGGSVAGLADDLGKLQLASKENQPVFEASRDIFLAVAEATTVMGKSQEDTKGILRAVGQVASKNKFQMEEVLQMAERGIPVLGLLQKSLNVSGQDLAKMFERGEVPAEALIGLAEELRDMFSGGVDSAIKTTRASLGRMASAVWEAKVAFGAGLDPAVGAVANRVTELLSEGARLEEWGAAVGNVLLRAADVAELLANNWRLIKVVLLSLLALQVTAWVNSLIIGFAKAIIAIKGKAFAVSDLTVKTVTWTASSTAAAGAQSTAATATGKLAAGMMIQGATMAALTAQTTSWTAATTAAIGAQNAAAVSSTRLLGSTTALTVAGTAQTGALAATSGQTVVWTAATTAAAGAQNAAAAATGRLLTVLVPLKVVLAGILVALFGLNEAVTAWGDQMTAQIDRVVDASADLRGIALDAQSAIQAYEEEAADGADIESLRALADELRTLEDEAQTAHQEATARVDEVKARVEELRALRDEQQAGVHLVIHGKEKTDALRELADTKEKLSALKAELEAAEANGRSFEHQLRAIREVLKGAPPALDKTSASVTSLGKRFDKVVESIQAQEKTTELMARLGWEARDAATAVQVLLSKDNSATEAQVLAVVARLRDARDATEALTEARREAERVAEETRQREEDGAAIIADLEAQVAAAHTLAGAYREGGTAYEEARRELELQERQHEATADAAEHQVAAIEALVAQLYELEQQQQGDERIAVLEAETEAMRLMSAAYQSGLSAVAGRAAGLRAAQAIEQATVGLLGEHAAAAERLARQQIVLNAELAAGGRLAQLEQELEITRRAQEAAAAAFEGRLVTQREYVKELRLQMQLQRDLAAIEALRAEALAGLEPTSDSEAEWRRINEVFDQYRERIEAAIRAQEELRESGQRTAGSLQEAFLDALSAIGSKLGEIGSMGESALHKMAGAASSAISVFQSLDASGMGADKAGALAGGSFLADLISGGGSKGYSGELGGLGSAIGSAWGPGGAALGDAIGKVVGSFINRGATQGVTMARQVGDDIVSQILEDDDGVGQQLAKIVEAFGATISELEAFVGAELQILEDLKLKFREGEGYSVIGEDGWRIDGLEDEAQVLEVMISRALSQLGDIPATVTENLRRVLEQGSKLGSLERAKDVLSLAKALDGMSDALGPAGAEVAASSRLTQQHMEIAREFNLVYADVLALERERLQQQRDTIVGQLSGATGGFDATGILAAVDAARDYSVAVEDLRQQRLAEIATLEEQRAATAETQEAVRSGLALTGGLVRGEFRDAIQSGLVTAEEFAHQMGRTGRSVEDLDAEIAALRDSFDGLPDAIDDEAIKRALASSAAQGGLQLIELLRQVHGAEYASGIQRQLQQAEYLATLWKTAEGLQHLVDSAGEMLTIGGSLQGLLDVVQDTIDGLADGSLSLDGDKPRRQGGTGGRRQFREDFLAETERLFRATVEGVAEGVLQMQDALLTLRENLSEAARMGVSAADIERRRAAELARLEAQLLAPFDAATAGPADFDQQLLDLEAQRLDALEQARLLAAESGEAVEEVFARLAESIDAGTSALVSDAIQQQIDALVQAGDLDGLYDLRDQLSGLDVPPEIRAFVEEHLPDLIGHIQDGARDLAAGAIDDLGLPMEETRQRLERLAGSVGILNRTLEEGDLSPERYAEVMGQLSAHLVGDLLGQIQAVSDRYYDGALLSEEQRAQWAEMRWALELAQIELQVEALENLGLLTAEQVAVFDGLLADARENKPDFDRSPEENAFDFTATLAPGLARLRSQADQVRKAVDAASAALADQTITQADYYALLETAGANAFLSLGDALLAFIQRHYGEVEGFEETRRVLEQLRFTMELAHFEAQLIMYRNLGLLTAEQVGMIEGAITFLKDNAPDFSAGNSTTAPVSGGGTGPAATGDPLADLRNLTAEMLGLISSWTDDGVGQALARTREVQRQIAEFQRRVNDEVTATQEAYFSIFVGDLSEDPEVLRARLEALDPSVHGEATIAAWEAMIAAAELGAAGAAQLEQIFSEALDVRDFSGIADLQSHFADLVTMVEELGLGAEGLLAVEEARQAAILEHWNQHLEGIRSLRDDLTAGTYAPLSARDSLIGAEDAFNAAQAQIFEDARFQELQQLMASGGDAAAIADLQAQLLADEDFAAALAGFDQLAMAYLESAEEYAGQSDLFETIRNQVLGSLDALLGVDLSGLPGEGGALDELEPAWMGTWAEEPSWMERWSRGPGGVWTARDLDRLAEPRFEPYREPRDRPRRDDETLKRIEEMLAVKFDDDDRYREEHKKPTDRAIRRVSALLERKDL